MTLSLIIGGCCSNVITFEHLLRKNSQVGTTMTFSQMLFITTQSLPAFVTWHSGKSFTILPRLKPRQVPLYQWAIQVLALTSGSLLNNWAFAYNIPLSLQIVFRSSGLPVSMLFGLTFFQRKYSFTQVASVILVTAGVVVATLSRPSSSSHQSSADPRTYYTGILMMTISLFLTGTLGALQERTYNRYGPCWREGVFYTHLLSLPIFLFVIPDIIQGFSLLENSSDRLSGVPISYLILGLNLVTQLVCVSGVNQLTSKVSSVSTNLVLTARKAISLCLSVLIFGSGWNSGLGVGASMVFIGSLLYTFGPTRRKS
ncbi:UAA transporter [Rickenella mellea]|uniref:UAA transporter n=1 Tax=Rickenella mellea TaxID=50990 RepID=A0A4Y7Q7G5_9AGAM|nr:UAA transporter [Rickenella mellea]